MKNYKTNLENYHLFFSCVLASIASQRFLFPNLVGYICLLTLLLTIFIKNKEIKSSLIIISLFLYEDMSVLDTNTSPLFIKYTLIILLLFIFLKYISFTKLKINRTIVFFVFIVIICINTLIIYISNSSLIDFNNARYFIFLLGILFLISCTNINKNLSLNLTFLIYPISFYLFGEIFNFFYFDHLWRDELRGYLNYSPLKSLILLPLLYLIIYKKNLLIIILLFICTNIIITGYGSRYIMVSLYMFIFAYIFFALRYRLIVKILFVLFGLLMLFYLSKNLAGGFKSTTFLITIFDISLNDFSWSNFIKETDKVRFMEHKLFFDQNIYSIIFGKGIGVGLYDTEGYLSFVKCDQTAFTCKEIISKVFYNFHDPWIDIGLRMGLLPFFIIVLRFLFNFYIYAKHETKKNFFLISSVLMLMINAWFQIIGLIAIFLIYKSISKNYEVYKI